MPCSSSVQQSNETDSHSNRFYVPSVYFGNDKKELACMNVSDDTECQLQNQIQSVQKVGFTIPPIAIP